MPAHSHAKKTPRRPKLRSIPGGQARDRRERSAVEDLLSGRIAHRPRKSSRKKKEIPPQSLPDDLQRLSDVLVAGRTVSRELEFKVKFAEQKVRDYCARDFVRRFTTLQRRPPSIDYSGAHSRFKFVVTARTTLTPEKIDYLRSMGIPVQKYTSLRGVRINYDAIRQHGLEDDLKKALASLNVPDGVIEECFEPVVELDETFYETLNHIVIESLGSGEKLEDKMQEVIQTLGPSTQIRNTEVIDLNVEQCFDLVHRTEIETEEEDVA